jgi:hypothetical protein
VSFSKKKNFQRKNCQLVFPTINLSVLVLCLVFHFSFSSPVVNPGSCLGSRARAALVSDDKVSPTLSCPGPIGATFPPLPSHLAFLGTRLEHVGRGFEGKEVISSSLLFFLALSLEHVGTVFEGKEVISSSFSLWLRIGHRFTVISRHAFHVRAQSSIEVIAGYSSSHSITPLISGWFLPFGPSVQRTSSQITPGDCLACSADIPVVSSMCVKAPCGFKRPITTQRNSATHIFSQRHEP